VGQAAASPIRADGNRRLAIVRSDGDGRERSLGVVALVCFGFFVVSAFRQRVEPNWPAPAYIPAIVLLARRLRTRRREVWIRAGVGLAGLMSLAIYLQGLAPVLPIAPPRDPVARAFGWSDLRLRVHARQCGSRGDGRRRGWRGSISEAGDSCAPVTCIRRRSRPICQAPKYGFVAAFAEVARR
jgi:hypothetical protein